MGEEEVKKEQQKKGCIGCLGLIIIIALFAWFSTDSNSSKEQKTTKTEQAVNWQPTLNAIDKAKEAGFLTRVDNPNRTVYVDMQFWYAMNAETKENSVRTFAQYLGYLNDMDQAVGATVKDDQSGKTIAEYSVFSGVSIK